jgi:hypothetical protein
MNARVPWESEQSEPDAETLAWFEADRIAMRRVFEGNRVRLF